jgi:hypothetical protein
MKKKNKRGFLLGEETLKIVIAVIAIFFLVYLLVSLYYASKKSKDLELAEASLNHLIEELNAKSPEIEIYNPKKWSVTSFPQKIFNQELIPQICTDNNWENCLCICSTPTSGTMLKTCSDKREGICLENEFTVIGGAGNNIEIKPPLILTVDYDNKVIIKIER